MQHVEIIWAFCLPGFLSYLLSFSVPWENNDGFWFARGGCGVGGSVPRLILMPWNISIFVIYKQPRGSIHKYVWLVSFQSKKSGQSVGQHFHNFYKFLEYFKTIMWLKGSLGMRTKLKSFQATKQCHKECQVRFVGLICSL